MAYNDGIRGRVAIVDEESINKKSGLLCICVDVDIIVERSFYCFTFVSMKLSSSERSLDIYISSPFVARQLCQCQHKSKRRKGHLTSVLALTQSSSDKRAIDVNVEWKDRLTSTSIVLFLLDNYIDANIDTNNERTT